MNNITILARLVSVDLYIVFGDAKVSGCILHLIFTRTGRRQDALFVVLAVSESCQEVKLSFISVCWPQDNVRSHQALVGSRATGKRAITESNGVISGL